MKNFQIVFLALYCHLRKMTPNVKITLDGFTIMESISKAATEIKI